MLYSLSVFNLLGENIPVETLDNRFIWDNVRVVTWSSLLSETTGNNNPPLCKMGTLNNVSRCVWRTVELRTGYPAGSPNLFFSSLALSLSLSHALVHFVSAHAPSECQDINQLSAVIRVQRLD